MHFKQRDVSSESMKEGIIDCRARNAQFCKSEFQKSQGMDLATEGIGQCLGAKAGPKHGLVRMVKGADKCRHRIEI